MGIMITAHENLGKSDPIRSDVPISKRSSILKINSTMDGINAMTNRVDTQFLQTSSKCSQFGRCAAHSIKIMIQIMISSGEKTTKKVTW